MKQIAPPLTEHRCSRLIAWGRLLLAWVGALMFADTLGRISERHLLARFYYSDLDRLAATIANIVLLHAFAKLKSRGGGKPFTVCDYSAHGFVRRTRVRSIRRASSGAWLRNRLNHRDPQTRFARLVQALNEIDTLATRIARRFRHGLTRLFGLRAVRPPHDAARTLALAPIFAADSS